MPTPQETAASAHSVDAKGGQISASPSPNNGNNESQSLCCVNSTSSGSDTRTNGTSHNIDTNHTNDTNTTRERRVPPLGGCQGRPDLCWSPPPSASERKRNNVKGSKACGGCQGRQDLCCPPRPCTSERGGNNSKRLKDFCLKAKARIWPLTVLYVPYLLDSPASVFKTFVLKLTRAKAEICLICAELSRQQYELSCSSFIVWSTGVPRS